MTKTILKKKKLYLEFEISISSQSSSPQKSLRVICD